MVIEEVQAGRRTPEGRTPFRPDTPRLVPALVLAELGADVRQQHGEAERLGDVVVGARFVATRLRRHSSRSRQWRGIPAC